jgi:hypothetical protein
MKHSRGGSYFEGCPLCTEQDYRLKFSGKPKKNGKEIKLERQLSFVCDRSM